MIVILIGCIIVTCLTPLLMLTSATPFIALIFSLGGAVAILGSMHKIMEDRFVKIVAGERVRLIFHDEHLSVAQRLDDSLDPNGVIKLTDKYEVPQGVQVEDVLVMTKTGLVIKKPTDDTLTPPAASSETT